MAELSLLEAFAARHSTRTFGGSTFPAEKAEKLREIISEVNAIETPFKCETKVSIHGPGLGRIGFVSNETGWLLGQIIESTPSDRIKQAHMDVSYRLQIALMKMTQVGIQTVWIGGTYQQGKAESSCPGWKVPIVIAYGEESSPHLMSKIIKFVMPKGSRKPYESLFFDKSTNKPITEESAGERLPLIRALRSGPTAVNQQGWRFVFDGNTVHMFDAIANSYSLFDNGIGMANLHLLGAMNGTGDIFFADTPESSPLGGEYICSVHI